MARNARVGVLGARPAVEQLISTERQPMNLMQIAKAIVGAAVAALTTLAGFLLPGTTAAIVVAVALAFLLALGAVFITPNSTPPAPPAITPPPPPQTPTQISDQAAKAARLAHDLNMFRGDMNYQAAREAAWRRTNLHRLAHGLPAWHFRLARPVPACGNPPITPAVS